MSSQDFKRNILFKNLRLVSWGKDKYLYVFENRAFSRYSLWVIGGPNSYSHVDNNPCTRIDPLGLWYIDINGSIGWVGGITGGVIIGSKGIYPYVGFGVMTPAGIAVTYSPDDPIPGWTMGYQIGYWAGFQVGWSFDEKASSFREFGVVTPGASITMYHIWEPWLWPWIEKEEDKFKK